MEFSERMDLFGESIFTTLAKMRKERKEKGLNVVDLSIGAPNIAPAKHIMEVISKECLNPSNYLYAITDKDQLLDAVKQWYLRIYNV